MKYPKLPRKLNRGCKLTEEDIEVVYSMRKNGSTLEQIGNKFKVSKSAIVYVLMTPEQKKEKNWKRHHIYKQDRKKANEASKNARKYKQQVLADEMGMAQKINSAEFRRNHPEYTKQADKKHYYKEKINGEWLGAVQRRNYRQYTTR
jgi:hypothetical protein